MIHCAHTHLGLGFYTLRRTNVKTGDASPGGHLEDWSKMPAMTELKSWLPDQALTVREVCLSWPELCPCWREDQAWGLPRARRPLMARRRQEKEGDGTPGRVRTCDPLLRRYSGKCELDDSKIPYNFLPDGVAD